MRRVQVVIAAILVCAASTSIGLARVDAYYNGTCSDGTLRNIHAYQNLDASEDLSGVLLKGSSGDFDVERQLWPCTPAGAGFSVLLAANLQQQNGGGIVQIGIGRQNSSTGGWPASSDPVFVWTGDDYGPGYLSKLTWFGGGTQPIAGHQYGFSVYMSSWTSDASKPAWTYCIYDNTAGNNWCTQIHRHWNNSAWGESVAHGGSYGEIAWSGFEVENSMDAIGTPTNLSAINLYRINGKRQDNNLWVTKAPISTCKVDAWAPSQFVCGVRTTQVPADTIFAQTLPR